MGLSLTAPWDLLPLVNRDTLLFPETTMEAVATYVEEQNPSVSPEQFATLESAVNSKASATSVSALNDAVVAQAGLLTQLRSLGVAPGHSEIAKTAFTPPPSYDIPTITEGAGAATSISSGVLKAPLRTVASGPWDPTDPTFEITGSPAIEPYSSFASVYLQSQQHVNAPNAAYVWKFNVAFETNAPQIEFRMIAASTPKFGLVRVNGRFISESAVQLTAAGGAQYTVKLTFADSRPRLIEIFSVAPRGGFGGAWTTPGCYITRPKRKILRKVGFIGSSITDGALAVGNMETYALRLAQMIGADSVVLGGVGGSGWVTLGPGNSKYRDRIAGMLAQNPDVLIFEGSRNDWVAGRTNAAAITAEVQYVLDQTASVKERYGLSVFTAGSEYTYINDAVKAGFVSRGVPYADIAGAIYGTGRVGATTGDGNADNFIGSDGVHPIDVGHKALAQWYFDALITLYTIAIR